MTVVTVTEIKHQARLAQWRDKIVDCRSNGNNVKRWCAENNVSDATYYRWEREIFGHAQERRNMEALPANTTFAELPAPKKSVSGTPVSGCIATVRVREISIDVYQDTEIAVIKALVEALLSC